MAVERPTSVRVGAFNYSISYVEEKDWLKRSEERQDKDSGYCHNSRLTIEIRLHPECHEDILREILTHEILHACWWTSGLVTREARFVDQNEDEEEQVSALAPHVLAVTRDNPDVMKYLTKL